MIDTDELEVRHSIDQTQIINEDSKTLQDERTDSADEAAELGMLNRARGNQDIYSLLNQDSIKMKKK
jgi:hypothetical protein|tara:strand:+ start:114 stop:314 length:201 start_codon:yes stop_codon:yes gene_type:complete